MPSLGTCPGAPRFRELQIAWCCDPLNADLCVYVRCMNLLGRYNRADTLFEVRGLCIRKFIRISSFTYTFSAGKDICQKKTKAGCLHRFFLRPDTLGTQWRVLRLNCRGLLFWAPCLCLQDPFSFFLFRIFSYKTRVLSASCCGRGWRHVWYCTGSGG